MASRPAVREAHEGATTSIELLSELLFETLVRRRVNKGQGMVLTAGRLVGAGFRAEWRLLVPSEAVV